MTYENTRVYQGRYATVIVCGRDPQRGGPPSIVLRIGATDDVNSLASAQVALGGADLGANFTACPEKGVQVSCYVPWLGSAYASVGALAGAVAAVLGEETRSLRAAAHFSTESVDGPEVEWDFWSGPEAAEWRSGLVSLWSAVFGPYRCVTRVVEDAEGNVDMGAMAPLRARASLTKTTYTRPRWPGTWLVARRVQFDPVTPVTLRGRDIDSISFPAQSIADGARKFRQRVLSESVRGPAWEPVEPT